jgi:hypothetical protein
MLTLRVRLRPASKSGPDTKLPSSTASIGGGKRWVRILRAFVILRKLLLMHGCYIAIFGYYW